MININDKNIGINEKSLNDLYLVINKKEDNIKDLINEKDILIKEITKKLEDINNSNNHKFSAIEESINIIRNELKVKDNKINEMNNKIIEQEKEIKNYKEKIDLLNKQFEEIPKKYVKKSSKNYNWSKRYKYT